MPDYFPSARLGYDDRDGYIILVARDQTSAFSSTWKWDGSRWTELLPASATPYEIWHNPIYDPNLGMTVVLGTHPNSVCPSIGPCRLGTLLGWNGSSWTDLKVGAWPPTASGTLVFDSSRSRLCLLSASSVWEFDGKSWSGPTATTPSDRVEAGYAYDPVSKRVFMVGGNVMGVNKLNDTWTWDGSSWKQVSAATGSLSYTVAYDPAEKRLVAVDAYGAMSYWDGSTWRPTNAAISNSQGLGELVYDAAHRELVGIQGKLGIDYNVSSKTWVYANGSWRQVA